MLSKGVVDISLFSRENVGLESVSEKLKKCSGVVCPYFRKVPEKISAFYLFIMRLCNG